MVGPDRIYPDSMLAKFLPGTFDSIKPLLASDETRSGFIRFAVAREIERRQEYTAKRLARAAAAAAPKPPSSPPPAYVAPSLPPPPFVGPRDDNTR